MPSMFWFNTVALSTSIVVSISLALIVLGSGPKRAINRLFTCFALAMGAAAAFDLLRHLCLWLEVGDALLLTELAFPASVSSGPFLLLFTTLYLSRRSRWTDLAAILGLVVIAVLCVPLFRHQLFSGVYLDANGIARTESNPWQVLAVQIATFFNIWCLVLFWQERRRLKDWYLALGVLILFGGYFMNGALRPTFPLTSVTDALSIVVAGYGIITRQLFNPLQELTEELEQRVAERTRELEQAYAEVEKRVEERTVELRRSEARFRAIYEGSRDAILLLGEEGVFDFNARALEMFGFESKEAFAAGSLTDLSPELQPDGRQSETAVQERVQTALEQGHDSFEWVFQRDGEDAFPAEVVLSAFDLGEERVLRVAVRDITGRKEAEAERERLQQEVVEAQQQALQDLSTPVIPVYGRAGVGGIIVVPLVGSIDSVRARDITRTLLAGIRKHKARVVILDITGVPIVDSGVADHLNRTIRAARLKGARTIVTGISDAVAETIVDLGIDWGSIETLANLQTGLLAALNSLGIELAMSSGRQSLSDE